MYGDVTIVVMMLYDVTIVVMMLYDVTIVVMILYVIGCYIITSCRPLHVCHYMQEYEGQSPEVADSISEL